MGKGSAPTLSWAFCQRTTVNKTNGPLPQGAYNLLVEVTNQQENKLSRVDLHTVTSPMEGMYRVLLA